MQVIMEKISLNGLIFNENFKKNVIEKNILKINKIVNWQKNNLYMFLKDNLRKKIREQHLGGLFMKLVMII